MSAESPKLYTFIELPVFSRQLEALASFETLYAIQADLLVDPERWPMIRGTGGARKGRIADPAQLTRKKRELPLHLSVP